MYLKYDTSKTILDKDELIKIQKNAIIDKTYKNQLNRTIDYYEERIESFKKFKEDYEKEKSHGKTID